MNKGTFFQHRCQFYFFIFPNFRTFNITSNHHAGKKNILAHVEYLSSPSSRYSSLRNRSNDSITPNTSIEIIKGLISIHSMDAELITQSKF